MIRACLLALLFVLAACSAEDAKNSPLQQIRAPSGMEKLMACTGLPSEGQECALPVAKP
jgi:hypothetical protein